MFAVKSGAYPRVEHLKDVSLGQAADLNHKHQTRLQRLGRDKHTSLECTWKEIERGDNRKDRKRKEKRGRKKKKTKETKEDSEVQRREKRCRGIEEQKKNKKEREGERKKRKEIQKGLERQGERQELNRSKDTVIEREGERYRDEN